MRVKRSFLVFFILFGLIQCGAPGASLGNGGGVTLDDPGNNDDTGDEAIVGLSYDTHGSSSHIPAVSESTGIIGCTDRTTSDPETDYLEVSCDDTDSAIYYCLDDVVVLETGSTDESIDEIVQLDCTDGVLSETGLTVSSESPEFSILSHF